MKKVLFVCFMTILLSACASHNSTYKLVSYESTSRTFIINVNNNNDVDIAIYGIWNNEYNIYVGYESWFPAIKYAKNSIEKGELSGSWLDNCKNKVVVWKSEDKNFKNARIDILDGPEDIFRH